MNVFTHLPKPLKRIHWKYRLLQRQIHRRFSDSVTLETQQGIFKLPLDTDDVISQHLYTRGQYELEWIADSLAFLRSQQLCPPRGQGTVLDIGANNGVISIGMLATDGHIVHGALAGCGDALGQSLGQRAEHHVGDPLRGFDIAAGYGRGRLRVDDTVFRSAHSHRCKTAVIHWHLIVDEAAYSVVAGRLCDGDDCVERAVHDRCCATEVKGDPIAVDDGCAPDRYQRNLTVSPRSAFYQFQDIFEMVEAVGPSGDGCANQLARRGLESRTHCLYPTG